MSATPAFRDRIKELRRIPAGELIPNPKNRRRHPAKQAAALRGILSEVGYADALVAREDDHGKLLLLDGHLRAGLDPKQLVPVLVLDVSEEEGDKILASLDPLAAMAETDKSALAELLAGLDIETEALAAALEGLVPQPPEDFPSKDEGIDTDFKCPKCGFAWSGKQA